MLLLDDKLLEITKYITLLHQCDVLNKIHVINLLQVEQQSIL